jgi:diacylglycerol kinase (ATP)
MDYSASLIFNPAAGAFSLEPILPEIIVALQAYGWQVELYKTQQRGDIGRLAQEAVRKGCDVVLVAGGDGSLNEAANALVHSPAIIGMLPTGTSNVWARQLGMPIPTPWNPNKVLEAARALAEGQVRTIDLGLVAGRYFVMWSGVGLDAVIAAAIEPKPPIVRRFGMVGYAARVIRIAMRYRGARMDIQTDQETFHTHAFLAVASNGPLYGAILRLAPAAVLDDGCLDLTVLQGESLFAVLARACNLLLGRVTRDPQAILCRARCIQISTPGPVPVQVDGEPLTVTPVTIEVIPQALHVLAPRGAPASLFQTDAD